MNPDEIKKTLDKSINDDCDNCFNTFGNCLKNLMINALNYINELETENKRLNKKVEELSEVLSDSIKIKVKEIKSEAIKEFAERLKEKIDCETHTSEGFYFMCIESIDNLVKEMVGEK